MQLSNRSDATRGKGNALVGYSWGEKGISRVLELLGEPLGISDRARIPPNRLRDEPVDADVVNAQQGNLDPIRLQAGLRELSCRYVAKPRYCLEIHSRNPLQLSMIGWSPS